MVTINQIEKFLAQPSFVIAGVSRNPKKFGNYIYKTLQERGFNVLALNPNTDAAEGIPCYRNLESLPPGDHALIISTHKQEALDIAAKAISRGISHIWFQQGSCKAEDLKPLISADTNLIAGKCILMFAEPVNSMHKFHRTLARIFGQFPPRS